MRHWKVWTLIGGAVLIVGLLLFTTGAGAATRKAVPRLWGGGGACRTLLGNEQAIKDMQALRAEHRKDMQAWWEKYGSDPNSVAAREALKQLRQEHWSDMQKLFKKYGITVPRNAGTVRPGMMGGGFGGMMGGGGCGGRWNAEPAPSSGATPGTSGGTSYGPGMMGGGYGGMMGQSL